MDASPISRREPGENSDARLAPGVADSLALGTLDAAARACGGGRSRGLLAESAWALAELVAHCGGALGRVGLAQLPVAFGLRGGLLTTADALQFLFAVVVAIGGVSELARRLGARQAPGYRAGARAATKRTQRAEV